MIAVDPKKDFEYVLVKDRKSPIDKQTVFLIHPLTLAECNIIEDYLSKAATENKFPLGTVKCMRLRMGLKGWRNFKDSKGAEVKFEKAEDGMVKEELLERLYPEDRTELANEIWQFTEITEEDEKN